MFVCYLAIGVGLLFYFWDGLYRAFLLLSQNWQAYAAQLLQAAQERITRKQSLKTKLEHLKHGKKDNFILQSYNDMSQILAATGEKEKEKQMRFVSIICSCIGVCIAVYLKSYMLFPILMVGLGLLPMWLIKFKLFRYNMRMQNELSIVLSMVTNSFIRCENIVSSVKENLIYMNEPLKSIFQGFVHANERVNPDTVGNLQELKMKISNAAFSLWCDTMISCQDDINSKANLSAVIEKFASDKEIYNLLSAEVSKPMKYYLIIAGLSATAFPLLPIMGQQLHLEGVMDILFQTVLGQAIVAGYAVVILYGLNVAINLSTSMD